MEAQKSDVAAEDALIEEINDQEMISPSGGDLTMRTAHLLKPLLGKEVLYFPPPPTILLPSNPNSQNSKKSCLIGSKTNPSPRWKLWVEILKPRYEEIWKRSGVYHAIMSSTYSVPRDKMLILGLAEFWCCDTNTFVFPWGEVTISLEDIVHLGCFSVLGSSISTPYDNECVEVFDCLRREIKKVKYVSGGSVTPTMWMEYFMNRPGKDVEHEAFLACWLSKFVFGRTQILMQDLNVAIHLSRGNRVALAPVVLACIYRDLRVLHNAMVKPVELGSGIGMKFTMWHYDLVQMWVWERFVELRPKPNDIEWGQPRAARWNGVTKLNVTDVRTALNNAKFLFLWRPYARIQSESMLSNLYKDNEQWVVVESDAVESFARCLRASNLVGLGYIEQYFPQRVAMQFGLDQDIPPLIRNIALGSYDRPIRGVKVYIPSRLFEPDVTTRYHSWWRGLLAVNENNVNNSNHDKQLLPLPCSGDQINAESLETPVSLSGCVMQRPETGPSTAQLNSQLEKPDSSDKRNDLGNDSILRSYDDVDEDSLTIAQYLNRSTKINSFENARNVGDEHVLNTVTSNLMAFAMGPEATKGLTCTSEPMEPSLPIMPSSNLCKESKSFTEKQGGPEEDVVATKNSKFTNIGPLEMTVHSLPSEKDRKKESSTERQTEVEEDAVRTGNLKVNDEPLVMSGDSMLSDKGKKRKSCIERETEVEEYAVVPRNLKFTIEPLKMSVSSMPFSGKKRKSSLERETEVEEDAVVTGNLKPLEISVHSMPSLTGKKSKSSSEKQAGGEEFAVASPEDNIINLEEESCEESQHLELMARICRLEKITDKINAVKSGASSTGNPEK